MNILLNAFLWLLRVSHWQYVGNDALTAKPRAYGIEFHWLVTFCNHLFPYVFKMRWNNL